MSLLFHARCDGALLDEWDSRDQAVDSTIVPSVAAKRYGVAGARASIVNAADGEVTKNQGTTTIAVGFWLRLPSGGLGVGQTITICWFNTNYAIRLTRVGADTVLQALVNATTFTDTTPITDTWVYVQALAVWDSPYDPATLDLYLDGAYRGQASAEGVSPPTSLWMGGMSATAGTNIVIDFDEVKAGDALVDVPPKNARACRAAYYRKMQNL